MPYMVKLATFSQKVLKYLKIFNVLYQKNGIIIYYADFIPVDVYLPCFKERGGEVLLNYSLTPSWPESLRKALSSHILHIKLCIFISMPDRWKCLPAGLRSCIIKLVTWFLAELYQSPLVELVDTETVIRRLCRFCPGELLVLHMYW